MLALASASPVLAQGTSREPSLEPIVPTPAAVGDGIQRATAATRCTTVDCAALTTILHTYLIFIDSAATPMGMGGWTPATAKQAFLLTRPATIRRRLRMRLLSRPDRFAAICARAEYLAAQYDSDADAKAGHEYFFVNSLIQTAMLIDTKCPEHCLSKVLAALPETPLANQLVRTAHDFCVRAQWHSAACGRIRR